MASNRHFARIIVMQSLYEWQNRGEVNLPDILARHLENHEFEENNIKFMLKLAEGISSRITEIDEVITVSAPEWPIPQIAQVDLAILRLAIFELLFDEEVPPKAAINEAVELAKAFGGENSSKFVNGVLGTVFRNSGRYNPETDEKKPAPAAEEPAAQPDQAAAN